MMSPSMLPSFPLHEGSRKSFESQTSKPHDDISGGSEYDAPLRLWMWDAVAGLRRRRVAVEPSRSQARQRVGRPARPARPPGLSCLASRQASQMSRQSRQGAPVGQLSQSADDQEASLLSSIQMPEVPLFNSVARKPVGWVGCHLEVRSRRILHRDATAYRLRACDSRCLQTLTALLRAAFPIPAGG